MTAFLVRGAALSVLWTNMNGGTNVTFVNSNLPVTSAFFWATGTYTLRLSANDSQYMTSSNIVFTVLPANHPPVVWPGTNQTVVLPALNTNVFQSVNVVQISGEVPYSIGVDYYARSNCVIASVNENQEGEPFNFELISSNGTASQFSSLSNQQNEVYLSAARNSLGGFKDGEMFSGNGANGQIMRIEPDGTAIGTNEWSVVDLQGDSITNYNGWVVLPNFTLSNGTSISPGLLRGGLWVDRTGIWGGFDCVKRQIRAWM